MKMKLFSSKTSPFARKVRVVIEELNLGSLVEEIATDPFNPSAEFLAANPLAQIPTLITEKGQPLADSNHIIDYLQSRGGTLTSLPRGSARWAAMQMAAMADGILEAAVSMLLESRRPESAQHQPWLERKTAAILRALDTLEAMAPDLITVETPRIAEITVAVALGYLDLRFAALNWRRNRPLLSNWFQEFSLRPSMVNTAPPTA